MTEPEFLAHTLSTLPKGGSYEVRDHKSLERVKDIENNILQ